MCNECLSLTRRGLFALAAGAGATMLAGGARAGEVKPDEALERLKAGNRKFVAAPQLCVVDPAAARAAVAKSQSPWATVFTCADSRVAPESIFGGVGPGELFVPRNAGNIADIDVIGSVEYAAEHLHSPLIVVMGHQRCGAVAAACDVVAKNAQIPGPTGTMVANIVPAVKAVQGKPGDLVDNAVRENARRSALAIHEASQIIAGLEREGKVKIVYARYDLDSGAVDFLG